MSSREWPAGSLDAPAAADFATCPATWYLFGPARELRKGPVTKKVIGRELVAYYTDSGKLVVMDARCAHVGADLGGGCVVGEEIKCPFHGWKYGTDGRCTSLHDGSPPPRFARQQVYPAQERHGFVFFFNGRTPLFPLPFFIGETPENFVAGRPFHFAADISWYMLVSNGFDLEHFHTVHDRTMVAPPTIDCPAPFARRMQYKAEVTGTSIFDRLLRWFVGKYVSVSIVSWGGPFVLVSGNFQRAGSYMIVATQPRTDGWTLTEVIVFARRRTSWLSRWLQPLSLRVRRIFTQGFMRDDIDMLMGVRYNPHTFVEGDRLMVDFFRWVAALPQAEVSPTERRIRDEVAHTT